MTAVTETRTTCPYCGVGCGLTVARDEAGGIAVKGDADHPANFGRTCSKGSALGETLGLDERLLHPVVDGARTDWNTALDRVASVFADTVAQHGPDAVAFYVSGQLLTEDYYVANKLMKGFIGSGNIDTNSRLCMASAVAGHKRAFGTDTVPGTYEDFEQADLVVLVGSNLAWCHPVLFQRLAAAKTARPDMTVVVIDPRRTMTARSADLHLALNPGSDVALFNGLLAHLMEAGKADAAFVDDHTSGVAAALAAARSLSLAEVAEITGLAQPELRRFYDLFARTERVVTGFSQGVNQSSSGSDKVNSILNCHLFTGRIGKVGSGPFSITGQPNAMGGREVGGLANQLACHMELGDAGHRRIVQGFWKSPRIADRPGLKAVDLFRAVKDGTVKALWIAGTNPVDSLPDADDVQAALQACPFVVVSDVMAVTDTARHAHVLLPAAAWGEKDGTVTNSERRISRQRPFLPMPGEARPDWWIFTAVARRMGWSDSFAYDRPADVFREYARLSGVENEGSRDFDISALGEITAAEYESFAPFQWPYAAGTDRSERRFFADGRFYTPDRRARFIATPFRAPAEQVSDALPLVLNTGRVRDQWHTMTRTALSPRLMGHIAEPFVEVHPDDATRFGVAAAGLAVIENPRGRMLARVLVTPDQKRGTIFAPLHWTDQLSAQARVDALVSPATDPVSGQPELKFTAVSLRSYEAAWYGFAVMANRPAEIEAGYWTLARAKDGWRLELADEGLPQDWTDFARMLFGIAEDATLEVLAYHDAASRQHRFAAFRDQRLIGALFVGPEPVAVSRAWAAEQLGLVVANPAARLRLLAGRAGADQPDRGAIVCACFDIGSNQIAAAASAGCQTVEAVGLATQAGTNCGSCRSEIRRIIDAAPVENNAQKAG